MAKDRFGYGTQMKIPSNPISKYTRENVGERPENLIGMTSNPSSLNVSEINTSQFDPSDINQVKAMQRSLGVKDDGIFGPVTEAAYRHMVNKRRQSQGLDEYQYEDPRRPGPDPIAEGYTADYYKNKDQGYKYAGHDSFGDFLKTDISNPETWASSRGRNLFGQEYGPEYQPFMMRNKQDLSKSLWSMLRGLFN